MEVHVLGRHLGITTAAVVLLYQTGLNQPQVAAQLGRLPGTVSYHLRKAGQVIRPARDGNITVPDQVILGMYESGSSIKAIAKRVSLDKKSVWGRLQYLGTPMRESGGKRSVHIDEGLAESMYINGLSADAVGVHFGVCRDLILKRLTARGVTIREKRSNNTVVRPLIADLAARYNKGDITLQDLAQETGYSGAAISKMFKKAGIPVRHNPLSFIKIHKPSGHIIRFDSGWEFRLFKVLLGQYSIGEFQFQGFRDTDLRPPHVILEAKLTWRPDFWVPSLESFVEVKGHFKARARWDSILAPAITTAGLRVVVVDFEPKGSWSAILSAATVLGGTK